MRKQSIKAAVVLLLASMLLASIPAPSYAEEGTSVYISDLDLSIVVPSRFDIFTREIAADDYLFTKYGITHDQLLTMMEAQNSYLDATVVYNGQQYYRTEMVTEAMGLSVKTTRVYHINNGYVYYFQFSGTTSDKYYKDFESLLDSVKYENLYGPKLFLGATIK